MGDRKILSLAGRGEDIGLGYGPSGLSQGQKPLLPHPVPVLHHFPVGLKKQDEPGSSSASLPPVPSRPKHKEPGVPWPPVPRRQRFLGK